MKYILESWIKKKKKEFLNEAWHLRTAKQDTRGKKEVNSIVTLQSLYSAFWLPLKPEDMTQREE